MNVNQLNMARKKKQLCRFCSIRICWNYVNCIKVKEFQLFKERIYFFAVVCKGSGVNKIKVLQSQSQ